MFNEDKIKFFFGTKFFFKFKKVFDPCCGGISDNGDETKVLNQKGEWVSGFEQISHLQLVNLISTSSLVPNKEYVILDAQASNPNCLISTVLVTAISPNMISVNGHRLQLVPDYNTLEIWHDTLPTPSIGDKVIYGSRVWVNLNGNLGAPKSMGNIIELDAEWEAVPYVEGVDYTYRSFLCEYDVVNDLIVKQQNNGYTCKGSKSIYTALGGNPLDLTDWNQDNKTGIQLINVEALAIVNNWNLTYSANVYTGIIANNSCEAIASVTTIFDKVYTQYSDLPCIQNNKCRAIAAISNGQSIQNIPDTVEKYTWVSDDETGYLEFDFGENPMVAGTYTVSCIGAKGVCITELSFGSTGDFADDSNITFGIDTDDPSIETLNTLIDLNPKTYVVTAVSNRTTDYNREIKITLSAPINSGKLWIVYKYV